MEFLPLDVCLSHVVRDDDADQLVQVRSEGSVSVCTPVPTDNFFRPDSSLNNKANSASMWIKVISSWLCLALYGWTLVAPIVLPDREFN